MPEFVTLTADNLDQHHLCCALGDPKHAAGVADKKAWLRERFGEGLVFRKLDVRGKVFVEYAPAEFAWRPIEAPGWLVVHCLWVSGRFAKQGYGRQLMESCLDDARAQGRAGVVIAAADRKRPFLSDPRFLKHLGFEEVDRRGVFRLYARAVRDEVVAPRFTESVAADDDADTFVARYHDQCPFNRHWAAEVVGHLEATGHRARVERIDSCAVARTVASPLGAYGLERGGELVCHHLTTERATRKAVDAAG